MGSRNVISSVAVEPDSGVSLLVEEITLTDDVQFLLRADSAGIPGVVAEVVVGK